MIMIDKQWNRDRNACYSDERLALLYPVAIPATESLVKADGGWADVTVADRRWLVARIMAEHPKFRVWLTRMVERLPQQTLEVLAVLAALRAELNASITDYASCTDDTTYAAYAAYTAADYADYADAASAAYAAADAAYAAADAADYADAEHRYQIADAVELLNETEKP